MHIVKSTVDSTGEPLILHLLLKPKISSCVLSLMPNNKKKTKPKKTKQNEDNTNRSLTSEPHVTPLGAMQILSSKLNS